MEQDSVNRVDEPLTGDAVLVVDDEADVAETTAITLEQRGLSVVWETSPRDALDRLDARDDIACVISDYQMPNLDGLELLEAMRSVDPYVPFLLFTGRGSERIASEAIDAGVDGYIQKGGMEQYDRLANRARAAVVRERRRRELAETKARFDALTQNTDFAIVTVDEESRIRYANDGVAEMFGYDPEELVGDALTTLIPDRLVDDHREGVRRYLETGERRLDWSWVELPAMTADGEELAVGISFGERSDASGHLFTGIIRDISERRSRERELERRKERFEAVFENAMDSIFVLDPDAERITDANPAASEMLGYSRETLRGMEIEEIHPDDAAELLAFAERVMAEREGGRFDTTCHTAAGDAIPAEVAGSTLTFDGAERFLAVVRPKTG